MNALTEILLVVCIVLPYSILFYKKISLSIRLIFASIFELFCLLTLILLVQVGHLNFLVGTVFLYNMIVWISILANILVILSIWILKKCGRSNMKNKGSYSVMGKMYCTSARVC